jgi:hypothetical protein
MCNRVLKLVLLLISVCYGCTKTVTETRIEYVRPEIPASVISSCDPIPSSTSVSTNGELLMAYISLQSSYVICASKVSSIANILNAYNERYTVKE